MQLRLQARIAELEEELEAERASRSKVCLLLLLANIVVADIELILSDIVSTTISCVTMQ